MHYILLDFEWDSAYCPKIKRFANVIVEIGAVKLDESFCETGRFSKIIHSLFTKRLTTRFKELTGMNNEDLKNGISLYEALSEYRLWAGENTVTMTWSNSDLYVLYDNCINFIGSPDLAVLGKYVDLQSYFQFMQSKLNAPLKNQISLSAAAELLNINIEDEHLHHAVDDSAVSARIFKKCYSEPEFESFILNTDSETFFKKLKFKSYYINTLKSKEIDKSELDFLCPKCGLKLKKTTPYKFKYTFFTATQRCNNCNTNFKTQVSFKKNFDSITVKRRIRKIDIKKEITASYNSKTPDKQ